MRHAPSVQYPVGRSFVYAGFLLSLAVLAAVLWWAAGQRYEVAGPVLWSGLFVGVMWACMAMWTWVRTPMGLLRWDPQANAGLDGETASRGAWIWRSAAYQGGVQVRQVKVAWDGQDLLLLRLSNAAGAVWWVWAHKSASRDSWDDFRRALVAGAGRF